MVKPQTNEVLVQKNYPNGFRETTLLNQLKEHDVQQLVVAGMMTHMCVDATARAATDFGFDCRIAQDACATRDLKLDNKLVPAPEVHTAFLAALNGSYGKVLTADAIMKELQQS